jgi:hypothetical protein
VLPHSDLLASLGALDSQFRVAVTSLDAAFCSKLAVIECCGWTEEAMDDLVSRCYLRCLNQPSSHKYCHNIVKTTNGFDYQTHFRKILGSVIGLTGIERLERNADQQKLGALESALFTLKAVRDTHAHTHIKGTITNMTAPSFVIGQFTHLLSGLKEIEARLAERAW